MGEASEGAAAGGARGGSSGARGGSAAMLGTAGFTNRSLGRRCCHNKRDVQAVKGANLLGIIVSRGLMLAYRKRDDECAVDFRFRFMRTDVNVYSFSVLLGKILMEMLCRLINFYKLLFATF